MAFIATLSATDNLHNQLWDTLMKDSNFLIVTNNINKFRKRSIRKIKCYTVITTFA